MHYESISPKKKCITKVRTLLIQIVVTKFRKKNCFDKFCNYIQKCVKKIHW